MFKYRGQRISKTDLHGYGLFQFLFLSPFLVGSGYYSYLFIYPLVKPILDGGQFDWKVFIFPVLVVCLIVFVGWFIVFLFSRWSFEHNGLFSRLRDRQKLANMIYDNKFYKETRKQETDILTKRLKTVTKIKLPKVYYKRGKGNIISVQFPLDGNRHQKRFLELGGELENMFSADNMAILRHKGFVEYQLFTNVLKSRISVTDVKGTKNGIYLMKGVTWNFNKFPHLLIGGGTGGGKTFLIMSLALGLLDVGEVDICDPKNSDLMALGRLPVFKGRVFTGKDIIGCLRRSQIEMVKRYKLMVDSPDFSMGRNYTHYGLKPKFIIVDEWSAFMTELSAEKDGKELVRECLSYLTQIVLKGRQSGVFIILGMQRPDTKYINGDLRDNFMYRLSVGDLSSDGYDMVFGEVNRGKNFKEAIIKGHGYVAEGGRFAHEFYSPFVPETFNFYDAFSKFGTQETIDTSTISMNKEEYSTLLHSMD